MLPNTKILVTVLLAISSTNGYLLSTIYSPSYYEVSLNVPLEVFTLENSTSYTGAVAINLTVLQNTSEIVLHASATYINVTSISINGGANISSYSVNSTTDILSVLLSSEIVTNQTYVLTLNFDGKLSTTDMYGFYKSRYTDSSNITHYLATTQFESTHARRAFPCFDEPRYKANFKISLTYPTGLNVLGNTAASSTIVSADNTTTTLFAVTPRMSTYLVSFIISDFTCTQGNPLEGNITYQVCSRTETESNRAWALEVAPLIIDSLNSYTGINYSTSISKLDQVAIPDFSAGAMENWGLVTYRERALLYDANETSNAYKQGIATTIAHELAHQWFGNLVTCRWWSEVFLNEGFATLLQFFIAHEIFPEYELDKQFVIKILQLVFEEDSSSTQSLRSNAQTPNEISAKFGGITYDKGGSIFRMVNHIMGTPAFKSGLNTYLSGLAYGSAEPDDLWEALQMHVNNSISNLPGANLSIVMRNWIEQPGFPVLSVSLNGSNLRISQERFVFNTNNTKNITWYVPITYKTSENDTSFDDTAPLAWLTPSADLNLTYPENSSWIIFNIQQTGYYRVNYDSGLWSRLANALQQTNFSGIPEINRAQIIDDAFNLARGGYITYSQVFNVTGFLASDTSYVTWFAAFNGFGYVIKRVGENSTLGREISKHVLNLTSALIASVPISVTNESNHLYTLNQVLAQTWACKLGNSDCITASIRLFEAYKNSSERPNKNLRSVVYCTALRYSSNVSVDWQFLWNAFLSTSLATEQVTLLEALGCCADRAILNSYMEKTLNDHSGIRSQDYAAVFSSVYRGSTTGVDVALDFFFNNYDAILERYNSMNGLGNILKGIAEQFTTTAQINKLQSLISRNVLNDTILEHANVALSSAQNNLEWVSKYQRDLYAYYGLEEETTPQISTTTTTTTKQSSPTTTGKPSSASKLPLMSYGFMLVVTLVLKLGMTNNF